MKKILASILVLTMLVCCMSISAFAVEAPATLTINDATVTAGETVVIPVNIKVEKDLAAVLCKLTIDEKLAGAEITKMKATMWSIDNDGTVMAGALNGMTGIADYYSPYNIVEKEGVVVEYTIQVPANAINGEYTLELFCNDFAYVAAGNEGGEGGRENTTTYEGATYSDTAVLTVVGGVDPEVPHEHDFSGAWVADDDNHWKVCAADEAIGEKAAHEYDNDKDAECNVCKAAREIEEDHEHVGSGEWQYDAENHWKVCEEDGQAADIGAHEYDDDQDATCDTCGFTREVAPVDPPHGDDDHEYEGEWKYDAENHWKECEADGQAGDVGAHEYDDEADEDCNVCGYKRTIAGGDEDNKDEDNKDEDNKDEDNKDETTKTGDSTNLFIYMAICLFAAAAIVVTSYKLKKSRG